MAVAPKCDDSQAVIKHTFWELEASSKEEASLFGRCRAHSDPLCYQEFDYSNAASSDKDDSDLKSVGTCSTICVSEDSGEESPTSTDLQVLPPLAPPRRFSRSEKKRLRGRGLRCGTTVASNAVARTTVMIRHLPASCTREKMEQFLNFVGFAEQYDFLYLPTNFRTLVCHRYAYLNMVTAAAAESLMASLHGFTGTCFVGQGEGALEVCWSENLQGLEACIERYRNSPIMHAAVPERLRPLLLCRGQPVNFPAPTCLLEKPRVKGPGKMNLELLQKCALSLARS